MEYPIKINYEYTNNLYKAKKWLQNLPELFAADFEVASRWGKRDKELINLRLNNPNLSDEVRRVSLQQLTSDGLSHPSLTYITHLSVAWSDRDSYVIVCDCLPIRDFVYKFLTDTTKTQIWHNAVFDFKHIYYHTGYIPYNYIDTQLMAKSLLNDANEFRGKVGLKELMGYAYGAWQIAREEFVLDEMWNDDVIKYSATDSPATYKLYQDMMEDLKRWKL